MSEINLASIWLRWVKARIERGENLLILVVGPTRSGKSYAAGRLGFDISKQFGTSFTANNVVFTPEEFLRLVKTEDIKRGTVVIWDELGVGLSSKEWFTISNLMINKVMQTFGHLGLIVIMTTPFMSYIDADLRKLFHYSIEMWPGKGTHDKRFGRLYEIHTSNRSKKVYYQRPVYIDAENGRQVLDTVSFTLPPKEWVVAYEEKAKAYKTKVMQTAANEVVGLRVHLGQVDVDEVVKSVQANLERYVRYYRNKAVIDKGLIERDFHIGTKIAERVKSAVRVSLPPTSILSYQTNRSRGKRARKPTTREVNYVG